MTTVRVFTYIFGALWVLAALFFLVLGIGLLVGGVGASSSLSSTGELGDLFGGLAALFGAFGAVSVGVGVVGALVAWFCFWTAARRRHPGPPTP